MRLDGLTDLTSTDYIARLNYGFTATKINKVCVVEGYAMHVFHIVLPHRNDTKQSARVPNTTACTKEHTAEHCINMVSLANTVWKLTNTMRQSIDEMIDKVYGFIPEVSQPRTAKVRQTRGLINAGGSLLSYVFGVAKEKDVEDVAKEVNLIKDLSSTAAADAERTRLGLSSFTKLTNDRLNGVHQILEKDNVRMNEMITEIKGVSETANLEFNAISYIARELANFVEIHDTILSLEQGIEELVSGHLTSRLIAVKMLDSVIKNITAKLRIDNLRLCHTTARGVFNTRNFDVVRSANDLFIRLKIPYTRLPWLTAYETNVLSLPVPGKSEWVTILKEIPSFIVIAPNSGIIGELKSLNKHQFIENTDIKWHQFKGKSCIFPILADQPDLVKQQCDFSTRKEVRKQTYLRLSQGVYVMSNYDELSMKCSNNNETQRIDGNTCLIELGCGCRVASFSANVVERICPTDQSDSDSTILHAVNLIVLQHFYDMTNLSITGKTLLNQYERISPAAVNWKLYGDKVDKLLAADNSASYSLSKLAASLQNDSKIFHTPAEVLLEDIITEQSLHKIWGLDLSVLNSWAIAFLFFVFVFLGFLQFRLRKEMIRKANLLTQCGVTASLISGAKAQNVHLKIIPTPTQISYNWEELKEYLYDDTVYLIMILIALIFVFVWTIYILHLALKMKSYIYIELRTASESLLIGYTRLPDASRCFHIALCSRPIKLTIVDCVLFGILKFEGTTWKLEDNRTHDRTDLPRRVIITRNEVKTAKTLLQNPDCQIGPLLVHTHEQVRYRVLNNDRADDMIEEFTTLI